MTSEDAAPTLPCPTLFWATPNSGVSRGLYVSSNSIIFPTVNRGAPYYNERFPDPWQWYFPSMMAGPSLATYWTCLLPQDQQFEGVFDPLRSIDVEQLDGPNGTVLWRLDPKCVPEWTRIEDLIYRCYRAVSSLVWIELDLKLGSKHCPLPSQYGLSRAFTKRKWAVQHIRKLRAVFMMWIVQIQFLSYTHSRDKNSWVDVAYEKQVISLKEYNDVRVSALCAGFSTARRIGFIFDTRWTLSVTRKESLLKLAKHFGLPVWIYYGPDPLNNPSALDLLGKKYLPDAGAIERVQGACEDGQGVKTLIQTPPSSMATDPQPGGLQFTWSNSPESVLPPAHDITQPAVNPVTGQRANESFRDFFARIDERIERAFANGTPEQRQIWTARRERHSALELPTNETHPSVFFWDDDGVRNFLGRKRWSEKFANSSKSQRRYDPVSNQWDICQFLDPNFQPEEEDYYGEVEQLEAPSFLCTEAARMDVDEDASSSQPPRPPSPPVASSSHRDFFPTPGAGMDVDEDASSSQPPRLPSPPVASSSHPDPPRLLTSLPSLPVVPLPHPLPDLCTPRSLPSSSTLPPPLATLPTPPRPRTPPTATSSSHPNSAPDNSRSPGGFVPLEPHHFRKILQTRYGLLHTLQRVQLPREIQLHYAKLQGPMLTSVYAHWKEEIPSDYAEGMRIYTAYSLAKLTPPSFLVDTAPNSPQRLEVPGHIRVIKVTLAGELWYIIRPTSLPVQDAPYLVATKDPLTVAQVLRESIANSTYQFAHMLVVKGMPFKTLRAYPYPRRLMWRPPPVPMFTANISIGLGVLSPGRNTFTLADYEAYVDRRYRIVQSGHGRAAFLFGGIVWRLAIESMADYSFVLDGPSQFPTTADYITVHGHGYVDDTLNDHELAIICGVYRLLPDKHRNAENRAKYMSWWPPASVWNGSGFDVGYWTPSNEAWFQDRLSKIMNGTEQPKDAAEWRRTLKHYEKHTHILLSESRRRTASIFTP